MSDDEDEPLEAAAERCVDRTRSAVLNVLVVVGGGIAMSGWVLGRREGGAFARDGVVAHRASIGGLVCLFVASQVLLRVASGRSALRDPISRAGRFATGHVAAAIVGGLAIPLGFAYGWAVEPRLEAVSPFWVVALASGFLAIPRRQELVGFDRPIPDAAGRGPA